MAAHDDIIALIEDNRDLVPAGVSLNYAIAHTHHPNGTPIAAADRVRADLEIKGHLRQQAQLRGNKARVSDVPADGTTDATMHVFFEFVNDAGVTMYASVSVADILSILAMAATPRRTAIRNQISNFLSELASRT